MKNRLLLRSLPAVALLGVAILPAAAQTGAPGSTGQPSGASGAALPAQTGAPGPTGQPSGVSGAALPTRNAPAARQGEFLQEMPAGASRVSKMIGVPVIGLDIKRLGQVGDVLIGRDGTAHGIVVRSGGILGVGGRSVAVPFASLLWNYDASPTDGASSSNTGGPPAEGGGTQMQSATAPRPDQPPETTGTVGDPNQPHEGLRPQGATVAVTGDGAPRQAVLRVTQQELDNAPEFKTE